MEKVGARELRNRLSHYLKRAKSGETVIVTDRGTSIAMLLPPPERDPAEVLKQLVAQGFASWGGGKPAAQIVIEERG